MRPSTQLVEAATSRPLWLLAAGGLVIQLGCVALAASAWGDWRSFLAHPARLSVVVALLALTVAAFMSGMSISTGKREDRQDRRILLPAIVGGLMLTWLLPFADRRGILTVDGDTARYFGLLLFIAGGMLRVWPMFVLGRRFSPFVAIQENHQLQTTGLYGVIRHPSYLGALLGVAGWALVFRSGIGLLLMIPALWLVVQRINAEERLLESEFGSDYAAYRGRTWRLLPLVY